MRGPHFHLFDDAKEGGQDATEGHNQPEPNRRWWVAAAAFGAAIYLGVFAVIAFIYWSL